MLGEMSESELIQTVEHLRELVATMQKKLEVRSNMLATLAPHISAAIEGIESLPPYAIMEFFRRHEVDFLKFKEEYGKEHHVCQNGDKAKS